MMYTITSRYNEHQQIKILDSIPGNICYYQILLQPALRFNISLELMDYSFKSFQMETNDARRSEGFMHESMATIGGRESLSGYEN